MRSLAVLGIDPGQCGAAAVVAHRDIVAWCAWSWLAGRGGRYRLASSSGRGAAASLYGVGGHIVTLGSPSRIVVEELFVARGLGAAAKGQRRSLIALAEGTGEMIGALRVLGAPIERVRAQQWRRDVLGLPTATPAAQAEEMAVIWASRMLNGWPSAAALTYAEEGALAEACAIAVWAT